ncbi:MAG: helix-turn-helix domain-containing protein [Anaerolineae bacterium]
MAGLFDRLQSEIETRQRMEGITPADLLDLSPELRRIINMIMRRREMSLAEIVLELDMRPSEVRGLLDTLVEKGVLKTFEVKEELRYKTFFAPKRVREVPLNVWEALSDKVK